MEAVVNQLDTIIGVMEKAWNIITTNPYLATFAGVGLLGVGIGVFSLIKNAAR